YATGDAVCGDRLSCGRSEDQCVWQLSPAFGDHAFNDGGMGKGMMIVVCFLCCITVYAQEEETSAQLEQLGEQTEQDVPLPEEDEHTQTLQAFARRRLNLNTADAG